jgi:hypothetical protein
LFWYSHPFFADVLTNQRTIYRFISYSAESISNYSRISSFLSLSLPILVHPLSEDWVLLYFSPSLLTLHSCIIMLEMSHFMCLSFLVFLSNFFLYWHRRITSIYAISQPT